MTTEYRYLDIIFIDNLIMNFVIIWITLKLSKLEHKAWRMWLAALIGALYALILLLPGFEVLSRLPLKIALSLTMLLIAFKFQNMIEFIKLTGIFYGVTFVFGGAAFGLYYFAGDAADIRNGVFFIKNYPVKKLIISCIIVFMLLRTVWYFIKSRISKDNLIYELEIHFDENSTKIEALIDTGNALCDPISRSPVIVVEFEKIKDLLPGEIKMIFSQALENNLEVVTKIISKSSWIERFRMIPFTALGKPNGMLIGFKPDKVFIWRNETFKEINNIVIGIYNARLSKEERYHALVNPDIIN